MILNKESLICVALVNVKGNFDCLKWLWWCENQRVIVCGIAGWSKSKLSVILLSDVKIGKTIVTECCEN